MDLISLVVVIVVIGVLLWAINTFIPMQGNVKTILNAVVCIVLVLVSACTIWRTARNCWSATEPMVISAKTMRHNAQKLQATPSWANPDLMHSFYRMASVFNLEVDHIIPLQSKTVCGLHVQHNLQLLTREQNSRKGNRYVH